MAISRRDALKLTTVLAVSAAIPGYAVKQSTKLTNKNFKKKNNRVVIEPERAIFVNSMYAYNEKKKRFGFATPKTSEIWKGKEGLVNAKAQHNWASAMYKYMFGY